MTERSAGLPAEKRGLRRARTPVRGRPENFYQSVLQEAEAGAFVEAGGEGLDDEIALLRVLIRRQIAEHPQQLELTIKGLHLLVRMVAVRFRLSDADKAELELRLSDAINRFAASLFPEEATHG